MSTSPGRCPCTRGKITTTPTAWRTTSTTWMTASTSTPTLTSTRRGRCYSSLSRWPLWLKYTPTPVFPLQLNMCTCRIMWNDRNSWTVLIKIYVLYVKWSKFTQFFRLLSEFQAVEWWRAPAMIALTNISRAVRSLSFIALQSVRHLSATNTFIVHAITISSGHCLSFHSCTIINFTVSVSWGTPCMSDAPL